MSSRTTGDSPELANKQLLVVGLARSGLAAANFLAGRGAQVTATDVRSEAELLKTLQSLNNSVTVRLGGHCHEDFLSAETIVISPGVPLSIPELTQAASAGIPIISEVELASRYIQGTLIGITGSNGKTTTATLVGRILESAGMKHVVAGNIGHPLTVFLEDSEINQKGTIFVAELSSFQLETVDTLRCHIALLLNVTPDHMDRYESFQSYRAAKQRIFLNQTREDYAIINADDRETAAVVPTLEAQVFPFSTVGNLNRGAFLQDGHVTIRWSDQELSLFSISDLQVKGTHNVENALAAASTAFLLGTSKEATTDALRGFTGVEHRLELVRSHRGVEYYNDSKATNVDSAVRAIRAFEDPITLIMGGLDKGTDFSPLRLAMSPQVRRVILIGKASRKLSETLEDLVPIERSASLAEAVEKAFQLALPGEIVLLAPACASFDMFTDYEERGRVFKELVHALPGNQENKNRQVRTQ